MATQLLTFEEHGEVLPFMNEAGFSSRTVICLDRHIDVKPVREDALGRLRDARHDPMAFCAMGRNPLFRDDASVAYGFDSFYTAAFHLGLIDRLVLVLSAEGGLSLEQLPSRLWNHLARCPGHGPEFLQTFTCTPYGARVSFNGSIIDVTIPSCLEKVPDLEGAHLDIDLDFFALEDGSPLHNPTETVRALMQQSLISESVTATYSVSSGFLPPHCRHLADEVARCLGRSLAPAGYSTPTATQVLSAWRQDHPVSAEEIEKIYAEDLEPLGAAGLSAKALLHITAGDFSQAQASIEQARSQGDMAVLPAHWLGTRYRANGDLKQAAYWFETNITDLYDTLQAESLIALLECYVSLGARTSALACAERCISEIPLQLWPYEIAADIHGDLGHADHSRLYSSLQDRIQMVRSRGITR